MKILITADLHYNIRRSVESTERLAERVCEEGGDALVLLGDTAGARIASLREALRLFVGFPGRKLLVPGNHCLWCEGEETSMDRYERILPETAAEEGFELLDHAPVALGSVGLVGSVGWYDYSYRERELGIPEEFYRHKVSPGAAEYFGSFGDLLERHRETLTERHYSIGARWMDGVHVRLGMSDEEFVSLLTEKLEIQLRQLAPRVERIVVCMHHLPFEALVPRGRPDRFAFAAAYMGAERFGQVLRDCRKVSHVYCGHSHWRQAIEVDHMRVVNIGSTYTDKRLEILRV